MKTAKSLKGKGKSRTSARTSPRPVPVFMGNYWTGSDPHPKLTHPNNGLDSGHQPSLPKPVPVFTGQGWK